MISPNRTRIMVNVTNLLIYLMLHNRLAFFMPSIHPDKDRLYFLILYFRTASATETNCGAFTVLCKHITSNWWFLDEDEIQDYKLEKNRYILLLNLIRNILSVMDLCVLELIRPQRLRCLLDGGGLNKIKRFILCHVLFIVFVLRSRKRKYMNPNQKFVRPVKITAPP